MLLYEAEKAGYGYKPTGYIECLKEWGFENIESDVHVVDVTEGFNDLWWISHIIVLRYMWEDPHLLRRWADLCEEYPKSDKWVWFVISHTDEKYYNAGHGLMHRGIKTLPDPKKVLASLKAQAKPLTGNAQGIHVAWTGQAWDHGIPIQGSDVEKYKYFTGVNP